MNTVDQQYKNLLKHILSNGNKKSDRTETGTISVFDYTMRFNMKEGFPLLTSKKMFTKGIIHELIWFLKGDTNIKYLIDNNVHIWDGDAYKNYKTKNIDNYLSQEDFIEKIKTDDDFAKKWGDLGPVYGKQWRKWGEVDQIQLLINDLKNNPDSRRLMVTAWNPAEIDQMVLPPCHYGFQCYTREMDEEERIKEWCDSIEKSILYGKNMNHDKLDKLGFPKRKLSLKWTQRSVDTFLGLPFNIASYGFLLHVLSKEVNMIPDELIFSGGDVHIYTNHIDQVNEQIQRDTFKLPKLDITFKSIDDIKYTDFNIIGYVSSGTLKGELSN